MTTDVTDLVSFQNNDDELLPLTLCVCGATFKPWDFTLGIYPDSPSTCDHCGRAFIFTFEIHVYEVDPPPDPD